MSQISNEWRQEIAAIYEAALQARHEDQVAVGLALCAKAIALLLPEERFQRAVLHSEMGILAEASSNSEQAIHCYRVAADAWPKSELISLQLFHALAGQNRWTDALTEAVRFTDLRDSSEYRDLFSASFGLDLPQAQRALAEQVRQNLARAERVERIGE